MCTVSWIHDHGGYELFCNRDELLTRRAALSPQILNVKGVKVIAPRDGDFGGSWVSVNEFGLSLCLLNLYRATPTTGEFTSRGLLLMDLADCQSGIQVAARIADMRLNRFRPFTLLTMETEGTALILNWDGRECLADYDGGKRMPLTSSSYDSESVIAERKSNFSRLAASAEAVDSDLLLEFHGSHLPVASAYSTCMHRADASTVSFSRIKVDRGLIQFRYHPGSPCRAGAGELHALPRMKR